MYFSFCPFICFQTSFCFLSSIFCFFILFIPFLLTLNSPFYLPVSVFKVILTSAQIWPTFLWLSGFLCPLNPPITKSFLTFPTVLSQSPKGRFTFCFPFFNEKHKKTPQKWQSKTYFRIIRFFYLFRNYLVRFTNVRLKLIGWNLFFYFNNIHKKNDKNIVT